ncbi:hypothetical protein HPB52_024387 [Rhipicephalus sanguineus]|uniref:Uncharacterized protein n=1 Tax=Rhipicephalus sanguineus TaxID=34632 RepID=A0A9D4TCC1_RHISA|nr:hypothetical protein HPB52_024387 [Rhipicephalus sanguineus]
MGRRRHRRRRRTSGRQRTSNALDSAESKPIHTQGTRAETSLNKSNAENADAGQCQITQTPETAETASSAESCGSGNENNLENNACCEFAGTDSTAGGKGGAEENRDEACPVFVTDTTAGHRGGTQDNRDEGCSKCEDSSIAGGKDATKDTREEACSKCAADSSAGGKGVPEDKVANREHGETPDIGSAREAVGKPRVHTVTVGDKDAEIVSATDPDVHMATLTDSDVVMVSASDPDVTMRTVSETDAAVMPFSVSFMCLKCHSQLGIQICGVHTVGPAQRVEAITQAALAQAPQRVSGDVQGFSVAPPYFLPQASPGLHMCNVSPSGQFQSSVTTSSCFFTPLPPVIQTFGMTSAQQQPFMATPPPSLTQVPWEIQMYNMPPNVQHQLPVNTWWPNSAQVPFGFQMHDFVDGTQRLPSVALVPSSGAIFHTQMRGYPSSCQLQPSMMTAPALQVPVPSAVEMRRLSTPNQPQPSMVTAPSIVFQGLPAAPIREFAMPGHFPPSYYMAAPPQVYNLSATGQPQYSSPPALQAAPGPCILEVNVNGQPQSSMAVPPAGSVVQMPAGVPMCDIPPSAQFQLPRAISPVTQFPPATQGFAAPSVLQDLMKERFEGVSAAGQPQHSADGLTYSFSQSKSRDETYGFATSGQRLSVMA